MVLRFTPLHDSCLVHQEVGKKTLTPFFFQCGHRSTEFDQSIVFLKVVEAGATILVDEGDNLGWEIHSMSTRTLYERRQFFPLISDFSRSFLESNKNVDSTVSFAYSTSVYAFYRASGPHD